MSQAVAGILLGLGLTAVIIVIVSGPFTLALGTFTEAGTEMTIGLYLDLLSATLLAFVASIALIVSSYSARNLRGQVRLTRFGALLTASFLVLSIMVTGASLPIIALGWTISGLLLSALVAHRPGRSAQRAGASVRRSLLVGDAFLWTGVVAAYVALPSVDRTALAAGVTPSTALTVAVLALGAAAVVRSALLPSAGWLPLTAEAPSPVSAYLHAGIVNGAAVLVALLWPMFYAVPLMLTAFILIGLTTALAATVASKVRPDVKGQLAASTSAQMGYMTIQLGLGLPAAAVLHLIGHGYYKAWMFLRAGGAVTRQRTAMSKPQLSRPEQAIGVVLALVAVGGTTAFVMPRIIDTLELLGVAGLLPVVAAGLTAAVALYSLWSRLSLGRWAATLAGFAATLAALGAYLVLLTTWDNALASALPEVPAWSTPAAVAWLALIAAGAVAMFWAIRRNAADPESRMAVAAVASAIPSRAQVSAAKVSEGSSDLPPDPFVAAELVRAGAQVVAPAFPLRSVVAANPLAGLEELPFIDAARVVARTHGARSFLPEAEYLRLLREGRITAEAIDAALADYVIDGYPIDREEVRRELLSRAEDPHTVVPGAGALTLTERVSGPGQGARWTRAEAARTFDGLWTARVWGQPAPPADGALYGRWRQAALNGWGRRQGLAAIASQLPEQADGAVARLLQLSGLPASEWFEYVCRLLTTAPGWAAHAAWRERAGFEQATVELVAVRMAHDIAIGGSAQEDSPLSMQLDPVVALADPLVRQRIWQGGLEEQYRSALVSDVSESAVRTGARETRKVSADAQLVFCIDVRSERFRRHLEQAGRYETFGFAGFFGATVRYRSEFGQSFDQCPVLLQPTHEVHARAHVTDSVVYAGRTAIGASWTTPGSPFALAEATGVLAGVMSAMHTFAPATTTKWGHAGAPAQWHPAADLDSIDHDPDATGALPVGFTVAELVELAYGALHAMGLNRDFAPLLVLAGHGATVQNNAFAAAYDCGACGGNSGLDNARILAHAINHPQVRVSLALRGIDIPESTVAVAALHDTTTDDLLIDDSGHLPEAAAAALAALREAAEQAGRATNAERLELLPGAPSVTGKAARRQVHRRAGDWAEACPEWGLAGNAAFIIGPRQLTKELDLSGRVFLHSYEPDQDTDASVLNTILNAPVVVAQWINSQYYFSTVDAERFGSGDKSTHNVVGDVGVLTGALGDLQVGLPWQAVFADEESVASGIGQHVPMRLSVVAYADHDRILQIVSESPKLRDLVTNEWISITAVDPLTGTSRRLQPGLRWLVADPDVETVTPPREPQVA